MQLLDVPFIDMVQYLRPILLIFSFTVIGLMPVAFVQEIPPAPAKVVRYAKTMVLRYDTSGDGVLQPEEWRRMPGTPKAIDLNGNGEVTLEEIVWYLNRFGQDRTIHRTIVRDTREPYRFNPDKMQFFNPVMPRAVAPPPVVNEATIPVSPDDDGVAEIMETHDESLDEDVYEKLLLERQIPSSRPFHVLPEVLRGVPAWFIVMDKNGDGQISLAEFAAPRYLPATMARFKQYDKNGNGFIEPDEVRRPQQ